jgi:exopolysaccharide production protein ExoZ
MLEKSRKTQRHFSNFANSLESRHCRKPPITNRVFSMERDKQVGIQVARAIAALSIVYFHSSVAIIRFPKDTAFPIPGLSHYGWVAVDLFFAISGFVICLVASRGVFNVRSFLIKRGFRLYPLWLVMLTIFAVTAGFWRGLQPGETFGFFLYSMSLLPTDGLPFYDIGWSLQHEIAFYLIAAALIPWSGLAGLAIFLAASTLAFHLFDLPWYLATLANHHGEFLAGTLAFIMREKIARFGFFLPFAVGTILLGYFLTLPTTTWYPVALLFLICAFANLNPSETIWWQKPATKLGDASYSIYLIHPVVFLVASAVVSKFPGAPLWSEEPIRAVCIVVIVTISLLSWEYFERPVNRFGRSVASSSAAPALNTVA